MCVLTMNQVSAHRPFGSYMEHLNEAHSKAKDAIQKCDSDLVVIAVQEMTNTYKDMFNEFVTDSFLEGLTTQYEAVGRCGSEISPGLVVLAKTSKRSDGLIARDFVAPIQGSCFKDDNKYGDKGAWTNVKGTVFLELFTVRGLLLSASTHSTYGDDESPRFQMISTQARRIADMKPAMVAWAGDFNMRTDVSAVVAQLKVVGTPHPDASELSNSKVDGTVKGNLNAEAAYDLLFNIDDAFGSGQTFAAAIQSSSGGFLAEVPGVKKLCPTYKKRASAGAWKDNGKKIPGTANRFGLFGKTQYDWSPSFACQAPDSTYGVEYYANPEDGSTRWPKHAPSWTERVVLHSGGASKCGPFQKAIPLSRDDHDALFVACEL
mmetsp:Transcript_1448/g.2224  ORF Transcript_1448/g.2224 Transcript_1448/m.2224 type:complete len:376 (-) Transcript_1448:25-1152(-)